MAISFLNSFLFWIKRKSGKRSLFLFVTNKCNYSCIHCFLGKTTKAKEKELTVSEIEKTYASLRKKINRVCITGGEPFLRKDIAKICGIFQGNSFVKLIFINTNGSAPDLIENKAKEILLNAPKKQTVIVTVSLDGLEEIHNKIRGKNDAFKNAVKSILLLKRLEKDNPNFRTRVLFTLMEINYKDFYSLFDFVERDLGAIFGFNWFRDGRAHGVDQNLIFEPMPMENDNLCRLPSVGRCEEIKVFLLKNQKQNLEERLVDKYTLKILKNKKFLFPCVAPELNLVIYANGDISFCESVKPFHNIRNFNYDLKKILKSEKWKKYTLAVKKCFCIHPCVLITSLQGNHLTDIKFEKFRNHLKKQCRREREGSES